MDRDWFDNEQLHDAAQEGDLAQIERLIAGGYDPNAFDSLGKTPLHYAAENEHFDAVAFLIAKGADVNAHHVPSIGNTPLAEIAQTCSLRMAQLLVKAGADPAIRGWMQLNAIDRAEGRKRGDGPQVYALLRAAADKSPNR